MRRLWIEVLEDRRLLDADLSGFAAGLRGTFTGFPNSFQNEITANVQRASLPLLGAPVSQLATNVNLRIGQIDSAVYTA